MSILADLTERAVATVTGLRTTLIASAACLAVGLGLGYYVAVGQAERNAARGNGQVVQAQKDHDDNLREKANAASDAADDRHKVAADKIQVIYQRIPSIVLIDKDCNFTADAVRQLNEAGR